MNKHKGFNMNIGTSSIILILLVFVLAAFSVRSIKAANNELRLADKTVLSIQEYYAADAKAENIIYVLDEMMVSTEEKQWAGKIEEINQQFEEMYDFEEIVMSEEEEGNIIYSFAMNIGEMAKLQVKVEVTEEKKCHIIEWRTVSERTDEVYNLEEDVELWDGNVEIEE